MKDIETGEEIFQDNYVVIINTENESVELNHDTFCNQIEINKEYNQSYSEDTTLEEFEADHMICRYEVRDQEGNVLRDEEKKGSPLHQYPFFIARNGPGFKKTLEYFATKEKISLN